MRKWLDPTRRQFASQGSRGEAERSVQGAGTRRASQSHWLPDWLAERYNRCTVGKKERTWYVYLLECADGTLYTGITLDPQRRVKQHDAGRGARYTSTRGPVRLLGCVAVPNWGDALRLEKRIKRSTPQRKRDFFTEHSAEDERT